MAVLENKPSKTLEFLTFFKFEHDFFSNSLNNYENFLKRYLLSV